MSAFGRGKRRCLLLARALGAAAAALAASFAWAGAPAAEPNRGGAIRLLSPEAPASFGAMGDLSPLIAAFNAARAPQDDGLRLMLFAEPKFGVSAVAAIAPGEVGLAGMVCRNGHGAWIDQDMLREIRKRLDAAAATHSSGETRK